ncbi:transcription factor IBH1-like [Juglans microcarpa x Juglans regia]|uniref:transcription factor IBH1-like n=1 Tax=Juglans microcarpa x Juglans regia TaxID=2249226 RepID=UPI001B7DC928|nr:transcription factor IBH1-like [Juglans microcarpa x Juglans regia]
MISKGATRNSNSRRIKFARRFVSALLHMRNQNPRPGSLSIEGSVRTRSQRIKIAAYLSMAQAVGSRRAWSRAVLSKLGSRARRHMRRMGRSSLGSLKKKRVIRSYSPGELGQAKKLRQLVPGGETMDICSLLEETAHYITCLATQVKVMQTLADNFSK